MGLELGIAQFATNENRLQLELDKRFKQRQQNSTAALNAMQEALQTEEDRAQFESACCKPVRRSKVAVPRQSAIWIWTITTHVPFLRLVNMPLWVCSIPKRLMTLCSTK